MNDPSVEPGLAASAASTLPGIVSPFARLAERLRVLFGSDHCDGPMSRHGVEREGIDSFEQPFAAKLLAQRVRAFLDTALVTG